MSMKNKIREKVVETVKSSMNSLLKSLQPTTGKKSSTTSSYEQVQMASLHGLGIYIGKFYISNNISDNYKFRGFPT